MIIRNKLPERQRRLYDMLKHGLPPIIRLPESAKAGMDPAIAKNVDHFALALSGLSSFNGKTIPAAGICFLEAENLKGRKWIGATSGNAGVGFGLLQGIFEADVDPRTKSGGFIAVIDASTPQGKQEQLTLAGAKILYAPTGKSPIEYAHLMADQEGHFEVNQYLHRGGLEAQWEFTLPHIEREVNRLGIPFRFLFSVALGTTSTAVAASIYFREVLPDVQVLGIASDKEEEKVPGSRTILGLGETGFNYTKEIPSERIITGVSKREAAIMSRRLYLDLVPAGWTSGLVIQGTNNHIAQMYKSGRSSEIVGPNGRTTVVSVFIDGPLPYAKEMNHLLGLAA
ncbi:MAG TPA: pyridoxal-phosphate dependent enzyme [Candidatus Paceibacterota bacterium]|jgi:cysteine synthase|nr:pyridoxal-phosphate dependent enzyme [Candidatus Paceibacterota bacterium]